MVNIEWKRGEWRIAGEEFDIRDLLLSFRRNVCTFSIQAHRDFSKGGGKWMVRSLLIRVKLRIPEYSKDSAVLTSLQTKENYSLKNQECVITVWAWLADFVCMTHVTSQLLNFLHLSKGGNNLYLQMLLWR